MRTINRRSRCYFTETARLAAAMKRQEIALHPRDIMAPEVFVVRVTPTSNTFTWELRRFGGVILHRGEDGLPSIRQAYNAGTLALAMLPSS